MAKDFRELMEQALSGELFERIKTAIKNSFRYDLGTHKKTRLKRAGAAGSRSLLHDDVAQKHAALLADELKKRAKKVGLEEANDRFRFMTVLQAVIEPDLEKVREAVEALEVDFRWTVGQMGLWSRGAIELEMVNLTILKKIRTLRDSEARKLNVLTDLTERKSLRVLWSPHLVRLPECSFTLTSSLTWVSIMKTLKQNSENASDDGGAGARNTSWR